MAIYKSRLPSAYQEVDSVSIINNSQNGFNNGFTIPTTWDSVDKITITLKVINYSIGHASISEQNILFRSGTASTPLSPYINIAKSSPTSLGLTGFTSTPYVGADLLTKKTTLTFTFTSTSTNNIYIGSWNDIAYSCSNEISEISLFHNGQLLHKFIPCYRKSDSVIGFFDLVNGVFYVNEGSGDFTKGNDVLTKIASVYQGTTRMTKIYKGEQCVFNDLPKGFVRCEYLESSGTEYIDSEIIASRTLRTIFCFRYIAFSNNYNRLFGKNNVIPIYGVRSSNDVGTNGYFYGESANTFLTTQTKIKLYEKYLLDFNNNMHFYINGVDNGVCSNETTETLNESIYLFAQRSGISQTAVGLSSIQLYYCQIYDNGTLVRNFIPCLDTNGTPCLYDTVSKTCFYNQGSGEFKYKVKVPSGYQAVEYIESTGTQYIDSGIIGKSTTDIVGFFQIKISSRGRTFGTRTSAYKYENYITVEGQNVINRFYYGNVHQLKILSSSIYNDYQEVELSIVGGVCKFNNETIITNTSTFNTNLNIALFATNWDGVVRNFGNEVRITKKGLQIYDNGTLVRDFVPCYRKADNVAGLYDLVNGVFYTNAGTGTFLKGADI